MPIDVLPLNLEPEQTWSRALQKTSLDGGRITGRIAELKATGDESLVALTAYRGKASAVMSASISPFGGLRGLMQLRQILSTIQMLVIPEQVVIPNAHTAFGDDGRLKDALPASLVDMTAARLVAVARALSA